MTTEIRAPEGQNATPATTPANVRNYDLDCPLCADEAEKKGEEHKKFPAAATHIWSPNVGDLEQLGYTGLIETISRNGKTFRRAKSVCPRHGNALREIEVPGTDHGIRTYQLSRTLERAAERRQERRQGQTRELLAKYLRQPGDGETLIGDSIPADTREQLEQLEEIGTAGSLEPASDTPKQSARPRPRTARNRRQK